MFLKMTAGAKGGTRGINIHYGHHHYTRDAPPPPSKPVSRLLQQLMTVIVLEISCVVDAPPNKG